VHLDKVTEHLQEAIAIVHARTFGMPDRPFLQYPDRRSKEAMEKRAAEERRKISQKNLKATSLTKKNADVKATFLKKKKKKANQDCTERGVREESLTCLHTIYLGNPESRHHQQPLLWGPFGHDERFVHTCEAVDVSGLNAGLHLQACNLQLSQGRISFPFFKA
jgi:hypothetical protein